MEQNQMEQQENEQQKISKDEFIAAMSSKIIVERHLKELNSQQRKELGLKSSKDARELQLQAVCLFCQSSTRNGLSIAQQVQRFSSQTKRERQDLYAKVILHISKLDQIVKKMAEAPHECTDECSDNCTEGLSQ
jgi:hypothetical protein